MEFYLHFNLNMDRSLGFGSIACDSFALLRLALASAPHLKCLRHEAEARASLNRAIQSYAIDPKPSDLTMSRLKWR